MGFEIAHVGINQDLADASLQVAENLHRAFDFSIESGNSSNFASPFIEITKSNYLGTNGHLAVRTSSIPRAIYYLQRRGFEVDMDTAKYKGNKLIAVYLKGEFGGFAFHLLQK